MPSYSNEPRSYIEDDKEMFEFAGLKFEICHNKCCDPFNPENKLEGYPVATCKECEHRHAID